MKRVDGTQIESVGPHYEQIGVRMSDGSLFYMSYKDLLVMMNEFIFDAEKKKTRTWLHPVTPDADVLYKQDQYPDYSDYPIEKP